MADLYVNGATGDDSRSKATAQNSATPWASIHRAAKGATFGGGTDSGEAAAAGDTVRIAAGIYEAVASDEVFYVALNPVNEGTEGNPIRFQAVDNARDAIRIVPHAGGDPAGGSAIGSVQKDWIEWAGFDLRESDWPFASDHNFQNGLALFQGDPFIEGVLCERSKFTGNATDTHDGDNYSGLRIHGVIGGIVRNCHFLDWGITDENTTGSTWYFGSELIYEHNLFQNSGCGVYMKNNSLLSVDPSFSILRLNLFENCYYGIIPFQSANGTDLDPIVISQNIFSGGNYGVKVSAQSTDIENSTHVKVVSNTFFNQAENAIAIAGKPLANASHEFFNNIISTTPVAVGGSAGVEASDLVTSKVLFEHNVYDEVADISQWTGIGDIDLATWRTTYGEDDTAPDGVEVDPLFVNTGAGDLHLQAGSPVLTQGRAIYDVGGADGTTIPAGAYITGDEVIGLTDGDSPAVEGVAGSPVMVFACL